MNEVKDSSSAHPSWVYYLADEDRLAELQQLGSTRGGPDDLRDGFVHLSTAEQVEQSARKHRKGIDGITLLEFRTDAFGPDLRWELARGGQAFPHLYAPLPQNALQGMARLNLGPDGFHIFPSLPLLNIE